MKSTKLEFGTEFKHQEETLKKCLRKYLPSLDEDSFNRCLRQRENGFHSILIQLIQDFESKVFQSRELAHKIVLAVAEEMMKDEGFAAWIGQSFMDVWIVLQIAKEQSLGLDQFKKLLKFIQQKRIDQDSIDFVVSLGNEFNIESIQNKEGVQDFLAKIQSHETWKALNSQFKNKSLSRATFSKSQNRQNNIELPSDQRNQFQENYDQMVKDLAGMKDSILDYFIQDNVIKAYGSQFLKKAQYKQKDYQDFIKKLQELTKKFDVFSTGLSMEFQQTPDKGKYYNKILNIRSKIHPVFVPQLMNLLNKGKRAGKIIQNKDTIVLLGQSGAGKSTIIQLLLGYKLQKGKGNDGIQTLIPTQQLKQQHKDFIAKASSKSVTRHVSAIKMDLSQYDYYEPIYLVDTPGFNDSGGIVVDACNSLSTMDILCSANSIRFGFIFNYKAWGKRADAFKEFVKLISRIFKSYENNSSKIIYILNQFTQDEINSFPNKIREFRKNGLNQYDKGDRKLVAVVDHLIQLLEKAEKKAKKNSKNDLIAAINNSDQLRLLDASQPNIQQIYEKILKPERRVINLKKQLDNFVSEQAKKTLSQEAVQLFSIINRCMQSKQIGALHYYYKNLLQIGKITKSVDDCAQAEQKCEKFRQRIKNQYEEKLGKFKIRMNKIPALNSDEATFSELKEEKYQLEQNVKYYQNLPGMPQFQRNLQIKEYIEEIQDKLLEMLDKSSGIPQDLYDTIQLFSKYFNSKFSEIFAKERLKKEKNIIEYIEGIINNHFDQFDDAYFKLIEIIKFTGDMEEKFNPVLLKIKAEKKIQEIFKNFEKFIEDQKACSSILNQSDAEKINNSLSTFSKESSQLPKMKEYFSKMRDITLELFRGYVAKIRSMKNHSETMNAQEQRAVFISKKNAMLLLSIKQIEREATYEFRVILDEVNLQIIGSNEKIDKLVEEIQKQTIKSMKDIYRLIRRLKRLNLLCQNRQRTQNNSKIAKSQQLLIAKLEGFETQIKFVNYNLETYNGNGTNKATQMLFFYKECTNIIQQYENSNKKKVRLEALVPPESNQPEGDKVVQICQQIVKKIKANIQSVLDQIGTITKDKMPTIKKIKDFSEIPDGIVVSQYWRIKKFFDMIKNTDFNPREMNIKIRTLKQDFFSSFYGNQQFLKELLLKKINQIQDQIRKNQMKSIQRQVVTGILKLYSLIDKISKLSGKLQSNQLPHQKDEQYQDIRLSNQVNRAISDLINSIQQEFERNYNNAAHEKCNCLINSCRNLERFDIIFKMENNSAINRFENLTKKLDDRVKANISSIEKLYQQFIVINTTKGLHGYRNVFSYYSKFPQQTLQYKRKNQMQENLQRIFSQNQKKLVSKIRQMAKRAQFSKEINKGSQNFEADLKQIFQSIQEIKEFVKIAKLKIQLKRKNEKQFGEGFFRLVQNQAEKAQKKIKNGNLDEAQEILQALDSLEELYDEFNTKNQAYNQLKVKYNCKNLNIAEKLKEQVEQLRGKRDIKYKNETIFIDEKFVEQILTYDPRKQKQIELKILKQNQRKIQEIKNSMKDPETLIQELESLKKKPEHVNLSDEIKQKVEGILNTSLKEAKEKYHHEITDAKSLKLSKITPLLKNEDRPHVLKIYEQKLNSQFQKTLEELKNLKDVENVVENAQKIIDEIFHKIQETDLSKHSNIKKMYEKFCENVVQTINAFLIVKRTNNLMKILYYQKYSKQSESSVEKLTKQIKQFLKLLYHNKKRLKTFDLKKSLQEIQVFNSFANELLKKNQLTFQQIGAIQTQSVFYSWRSQALYMNACLSGLKDIEEISQLEKFYSELESKFRQVQRKQEQLKQRVDKIIKELKLTEIYNENNKNISDHNRKEQLRKIQSKLNQIKALQKLGDQGASFFNKNFTKIFEYAEKTLQQQIENGIQQNCKDIKNGFEELQIQFNKEINVSMNLVADVKELAFIKIDKNLKKKIPAVIQQCYKNLELKIQQEVLKILEIKQLHENQIKKQLNENAQNRIKMEQQCQKQEKQMQNKLQKKLQGDLKTITDEVKIKQIKKANESQKKLKKRQIWQKLEDSTRNFQIEKSKKQLTGNQRLSMIFEKYCDLVTIFYKAILELNYNKDYYKDKLQKILTENKKIMKKKSFYIIYETLKRKRNNYASILIGSLEVFKSNQAIQWEAKVKGIDIQYVLKELAVAESKKDQLKNAFKIYQLQFKSWTKAYQANPTQETINKLLSSIKNSSDDCTKFYQSELKVEDFKPYNLIAKILVLWTILKSDIEEETVQFYYQPHPSQIITIFLCLSLGRDLYSTIAQVGTGEGKSLILAALSSYLALSGFQVNCVCYSEYLSSRDYTSYYKLFETLRISNKVMYGTFNTVCQSLFNKSGKQEKFSQQIKKILEGKPEKLGELLWNKFKNILQSIVPKFSMKEKSQSKSIMLIDEVDVFFDREYFGETYLPQVCLASTQIKQLIKYVWKKYKQNAAITHLDIMSSQQYKTVIKKYAKIEDILKQQIKGMILGCRNSNHDYIVRDDLIQYKENDGYSSKINYGFTTKFAYLKQHDYNRIASVQKAYEISCIIAEFSYAMLPKYFRCIIGVTGTYEDMPTFQKYYMRDQYKVTSAYVIPSVYGIKRRKQIKPQIITQPQNHYKEIIHQIQTVHGTQRPILVFFDTPSQMQSFYNCTAFQHLQNKTTFLNQTHNSGERDLRIKKTCQKKQITLMTKSFGRGTDFIVFDESILSLGGHGGLHVIQTFLSVEISEEIQIQGRTARQGDPGTYILIIKNTDLQKLEMPKQGIRNFEYEVNKARKQKQQKQYKDTIKLLKQSQLKHDQSIKVYLNQKINEKDIINYIWSLNKYPETRKKVCKTSIFFDGTVSMAGPISKLHSILDQVMKDISETIAKYPNAKQYQIQLGVYRNYNCNNNLILQTTSFENRPQTLLNFWRDVKVRGGMGNQALEVAYHYLNSQKELDQVIIIGDAAANTDQETIDKRKRFEDGGLVGESYWSKYFPILSAENELKAIITRKLPIHCFYIKADEYFKRVSNLTGGVAEKFNIQSPEASKNLSHFIATQILKKSAQSEAEAKLMLTQYENKEKKRYSS